MSGPKITATFSFEGEHYRATLYPDGEIVIFHVLKDRARPMGTAAELATHILITRP